MSKLLSRLVSLLELVVNRIKARPGAKNRQGLLSMYFVESNAKRNKMNRERQ
jgi:hypothetical protein